MSRLDELPPDQRAALSLLLRQRKSYGEVAGMLGLPERSVHDRAHAALAVLAPAQARGLPPERREEIGDYLLSQQPGVAERLHTRSYIGGSDAARAWAQALSDELSPLATTPLPDIPAPAVQAAPGTHAQPDAPAPPAAAPVSTTAAPAARAPLAAAQPPGSSAPSSRLGGALLLAAIVVAVVVAVILITSSGGSSKHAAKTTSSNASSKSGPTVGPQLPLRPPSPSSKSSGAVVVLSEKSKRAFYIEAQNLPATHGFYYAIWLYNSPTSAKALSRSPAVGSSHKLAGGSALPANAGSYHEILLTRETESRPTHPGKIVLRGAFRLTG
jgi:hypothetical protein